MRLEIISFTAALFIDLVTIFYAINISKKAGFSGNFYRTAILTGGSAFLFGLHHLSLLIFESTNIIEITSEVLEMVAVLIFGFASFQLYLYTVHSQTLKIRKVADEIVPSKFAQQLIDMLGPVMGIFSAKAYINISCILTSKKIEAINIDSKEIIATKLEEIFSHNLGPNFARIIKNRIFELR